MISKKLIVIIPIFLTLDFPRAIAPKSKHIIWLPTIALKFSEFRISNDSYCFVSDLFNSVFLFLRIPRS